METESLQMAGNNMINTCDIETGVSKSQALPDNATNVCGICNWKHFNYFIPKIFEFDKSESSLTLGNN